MTTEVIAGFTAAAGSPAAKFALRLFLEASMWLGAVIIIAGSCWLQVQLAICFWMAAKDATTGYLNSRTLGFGRWYLLIWPFMWLECIPDQVSARLAGGTVRVCRITKPENSALPEQPRDNA